jgi:hypothetical protein
MMYTLEDLHSMEMTQLNKEHGREPDPDMWRWSPYDIRHFDEMLTVAVQLAINEAVRLGQPLRQLSFVEAGSGIGTKLYWVKNKYGLIEVGYEINDEYLALSAELDVHAEKRDLRDMDNPPVWAAFDIVYLARPFKDDLFEYQWEESVHKDMRIGAVLMATFASVKPYKWPCYFRAPWRGVWQKPIHEPDEPQEQAMSGVTSA